MKTRLTLKMSAAAKEEEKNPKNGESKQKVPCDAVRSLQEMCDVLCEEAANGFNKQSRLTRDEKQICQKRFSEVFKQIFMSNVRVEQPDLQITEDGKKDSSDMNLEKKKSTSEALTIQLDDAILNIAQKRKEFPKLCVRNLKTYTKLELGYLNSVQVRIPPKPAVPTPPVSFHSPEESESLSKSLKLLSSLSKTTVKDCGRLENLETVKTIVKEVKKSKTHQLIFQTDDSPVPSKMTRSVSHCLQNQQMHRRQSPRFKRRTP
ncbi:uncharacterized protein LOC106867934 [Octopus bimaculoides]|uniref:Uncharacterized protein n=1 Tax=Octopus bimaculoides TaxID=37653 RepID=A0A0L8HZ40_OCTBM|nr:uncharacterized protein LOC106867934 [Octopus bimaculoides]|eukprot:XP_014768487.1 PREDICTED: uncharacterized protein LOC106867934 [Octopus bimaculoides]